MPSHAEAVREAKHEKQAEAKIAEPTCCICVPFRLGVFLNAFGTVVTGLMMIFGKSAFDWFETTVRQIYGGYGLYSKICVGTLEVSGIIWGIIGMSGAVYNSATRIGIFLMYQYARVVLWLVVYCLDMPELWTCETWVNNIDAKLKEGWNPTMYSVALNGRCFQERWIFGVFSLLALGFFIYLTMVNQKFYKKLQHQLTYKLDAKNESVRQWYTKSATEFHQNAENIRDWTQTAADGEINPGTYFMLHGEGSRHRQEWDDQGRWDEEKGTVRREQPAARAFQTRPRGLPTPTGFLGSNFEPAPAPGFNDAPQLGEQTPLMSSVPQTGTFPAPRGAFQSPPQPGHIPQGMMHGAQARY